MLKTLLPTATLNDTRDQTEPESEHVETTTAPGSTAPSVEASPAAGSRAPPPTPETQMGNADKIAPLDPIWEDDGDGLGEERRMPVQAPAQPSPQGPYLPERMATPSRATPSRSVLGEMPTNLTPTQRRLLVKQRTDIGEEDKMRIIQKMQSQAQNYMEETVERFRQTTKEAMFAQAQRQAAEKALYNISGMTKPLAVT